MNILLTLLFLFTTLAQATSHHERLGCKACIYEGHTWCSTYLSPYARTHCDTVIQEDMVCKTKVAKKLEHCDDRAYNPEAPPPEDALPANTTKVLNETTACNVKQVCDVNGTNCVPTAVCTKTICVFESVQLANTTDATTGLNTTKNYDNKTYCYNETVDATANIDDNKTVPEPVPEPPKIEPTVIWQTHEQMFLRWNSTRPNFYLIAKESYINTYRGFISAMLISAICGFGVEFLRFLKWWIAIRRRVTENCLQLMLGEVHYMQSKSEKEFVNQGRDHIDTEGTENEADLLQLGGDKTSYTFELFYYEKFMIIILFMMHRALQMLCAIIVMVSYHFFIIFALCGGFAAGNLIFAGLVQDQVLITRVQRKIAAKAVLNKKINEHNLKVTDYCLSGKKSLVSHYKESMSLQKIQVELEVIREVRQNVEDGEFNLNKRIWDDFQNRHEEPKYLYRKPASKAKKNRLQKQKTSKSDKSEEKEAAEPLNDGEMEFVDPVPDQLQQPEKAAAPGHKRNQSQQPLIAKNQVDKDQSIEEDMSNYASNKKLISKPPSDENNDNAGPGFDLDKKESSEEEEDSDEEDEEDEEDDEEESSEGSN